MRAGGGRPRAPGPAGSTGSGAEIPISVRAFATKCDGMEETDGPHERSCCVRFLANQDAIVSLRARATWVRVRERCTTAAPKRVTLATKHVTTARHKSFCNRRSFAIGALQQPKISFNAAAKTS